MVGFIKYSKIFEGNSAVNTAVTKIISKLRSQTSTHQRAILVIDTSIATKENFEKIKANGYDYVYVNRVQL